MSDHPPATDSQPFTLANHPPRRPRPALDATPRRQLPLWDGLDCLPGQQDLFDDDTAQQGAA